MAERNIKIVVEYNGTAYNGYQTQAVGHTIQTEIANAIEKVTGQQVSLLAAGRTDAGVHALGQVINFRIDCVLPTERFQPAINHYLDDDLLVKSAEEVPMAFHARYDATHKRYRYLIGLNPSALYRDQRWHYKEELDMALLKEAASILPGVHDFAAFCVVSSRKPDNRCRIDYAKWRKVGNLLIFEIRGNRFLHHMVRSLVGGMINLATVVSDHNSQNLTLESFTNIIRFPDDERNIFTAPARGLYLVSVGYNERSSK